MENSGLISMLRDDKVDGTAFRSACIYFSQTSRGCTVYLVEFHKGLQL